jgi:proline dehydrogenase
MPDPRVRPAIATHDERLIALTRQMAHRRQGAFEFQMLYGIRPALQQQLVAAGHKVRIYVPYGSAWYPYLVRRLAERPANLAFFLRALVSR